MNVGKMFKGPEGVVILIGVGAVALYFGYHALKGIGTQAAQAAGGIVTGNNAITTGTPYQGQGVAGTLGAATNAASGGTLAEFGTWLGGKIFDWTHPSTTTTTTASNPQQGGASPSQINIGG